MDKQEVLARLCALAARVMREKYNCDVPADCFCGETTTVHFQFHPDVLAFVENAVNAALKS